MPAKSHESATRRQGLWLVGIGILMTALGVGAVYLSLHHNVRVGGGVYVVPALGVLLILFGLIGVVSPGAGTSRSDGDAGEG